MLQPQTQSLRPLLIVDTPDIEPLREGFPEFDCFDFQSPPLTAGTREVVLWPRDTQFSRAAAAKIAEALFGAEEKPKSVHVAATSLQVAQGSGKRLQAPRQKVVYLSAQEKRAVAQQEVEDRKAAALAPVVFRTLAAVAQGSYSTPTPLFEDKDGHGILFPGAHLIVGRPKIGKSWMLLQLGLAVAEAATFLGMKCRRPGAEVLMILAEDNDERVQSRLGSLGVGRAPSNCYVVTLEGFQQLAGVRGKFQSFPEFLDNWLSENPNCRLVMVDTEVTCRQTWCGEATNGDDGRRITETDYRQTRDFDALALKHECVIGLVNHASKRKGEWADIHELINRSNTALAGCSGSLVLADPPDADPLDNTQKLRILGARARDMKDDLLLMVKQENDLPQFVNLGQYASVMQTQAELQVLEALEEIVQNDHIEGYVSVHDIAEITGKKSATIRQCCARMMRKPQGMFWKNYRLDSKRGRNGGVRLVQR